MKSKFLVVIVGPTGVGKTAFSIELAKMLSTEIISADSRQFFREMEIGTAKPSKEELDFVKHHFIDSHSITEEYNAGKYEAEAIPLIEELFQNQDVLILTGGSGLYVDAICNGFDEMPEKDTEAREALEKKLSEEGIESLREELKKTDPGYFKTVDLANPHRIMRALEVYRITGLPYSDLRKSNKTKRSFHIIKIGLNLPRETLYERINERVDEMIRKGLIGEVEKLKKLRTHNALQTVGYKEVFEYLDGKKSLDATIDLIKQNTRRYAKRQLTWFRKDKEIKWFDASERIEIIKYINSELNRS